MALTSNFLPVGVVHRRLELDLVGPVLALRAPRVVQLEFHLLGREHHAVEHGHECGDGLKSKIQFKEILRKRDWFEF